jgi:hypothetical protein
LNPLHVSNSDLLDLYLEPCFERISDLLRYESEGDVSPSAYDTAWFARLYGNDSLLFPEFLEWISNNQNNDGSWGVDYIECHSDRIVSTLNSIIALRLSNSHLHQIDRGVAYLNKLLANNTLDLTETVGFELIFPLLVEDAFALSIPLVVSQELLDKINLRREKKLQKIPLELVYNKQTTLLHSIEGLSDVIDVAKLGKFVLSNGSFLNSPAASAFIFDKNRDPKIFEYLDSIRKRFLSYSPVNYPLDIFESLWMVNDLYYSNLDHFFTNEIDYLLSRIYSYWSDTSGISWSQYIPISDLDDTSVAFKLFSINSFSIHDDVFKFFHDLQTETFFCLPGELSASPSHIASLLEALHYTRSKKDFITSAITHCSTDLIMSLERDVFLIDKWHLSPYYSTFKALLSLSLFSLPSKFDTWVNFFLNSYKYRIIKPYDLIYLLMGWVNFHSFLSQKEIVQFAKFLSQYDLELLTNQSPWIDKTIYTPQRLTELQLEIVKIYAYRERNKADFN